MFKLIPLLLIAYALYQGYAEYKARGNSVGPIDDFIKAYVARLQFWK